MNSISHDISPLLHSPQQTQSGGTQRLGFQLQRLGHGRSSGVDRITLTCGDKSVDILPTRGMGIWQAHCNGVRFGWDSPIDGPIHPNWVNLCEPDGLGWLDGFDEMMVRCGLASNGAPEFDDRGQLIWPLHGRIANLPASAIAIDIDDSAQRIAIRGTVLENRFHFRRLQLQTEIAISADSHEISIADTVTNLSNRPADIQMLYHNNFGPPLLEAGSRFFAPIKRLVPRNQHAASDLENWNQYSGPNPADAEQVYFLELAAGPDQHTLALLTNRDQTRGASIRYNTTHLPCFSLWKNTVGESDGYVTGLEPATNFPNPRSFEESHGRVVPLEPGQNCRFELHIGMLTDPQSVAATIDQISSLAADDPQVDTQPSPDWCSPG